jgi:hypothetical protein
VSTDRDALARVLYDAYGAAWATGRLTWPAVADTVIAAGWNRHDAPLGAERGCTESGCARVLALCDEAEAEGSLLNPRWVRAALADQPDEDGAS